MSKNLTNQVFLRVTSLSVNNITINAPQNVTYTLTLPSNAGTPGQYLSTNGSGLLSWSSSLPPSSTGVNLTLSGTLTAASVNVTGLTTSSAVATDVSKNLISVATTGTGNYVLSTSPTFSGTAVFVNMTVNTGNFTTLNVATLVPTIINLPVAIGPKISYYGARPNDFQYDGIGLSATAIKYQAFGSTQNHVFYSGVTSTTDLELFRIPGTGGFISNGNGEINVNSSGVIYPFQVKNTNTTPGTTTVIGVGQSNLSTGNANSAALSYSYTGNNNAANSCSIGISGNGKPSLLFQNNSTITVSNAVLNFSTAFDGSSKISMFGSPPNNFQYDGFSTLPNIFVYQTTSTSHAHVFYAGTSGSTRQELFRIPGTGGFTSTGNGTVTGNLSVSGSLTAPSPTFSGTANFTNISISGIANFTGTGRITLGTTSAVKKIDFFSGSNDFEFSGITNNGGDTRYHCFTPSNSHVFYSGNPTSYNELVRISGTGRIYGGFNISAYIASSTFTWPNAFNADAGGWSLNSAPRTYGLTLNNVFNGSFRNDTTSNVWARVSWTTRRNSNGFGISEYWIKEDINGFLWGRMTVAALDWVSMNACIFLASNSSFTLQGYQDSGSGNDFIANSLLTIQLLLT